MTDLALPSISADRHIRRGCRNHGVESVAGVHQVGALRDRGSRLWPRLLFLVPNARQHSNWNFLRGVVRRRDRFHHADRLAFLRSEFGCARNDRHCAHYRRRGGDQLAVEIGVAVILRWRAVSPEDI